LYPRPVFDVLRAPSENIVRAAGGRTALPPALAATAPLTAPGAAPAAAAGAGEAGR
jgi:hypothetical protein